MDLHSVRGLDRHTARHGHVKWSRWVTYGCPRRTSEYGWSGGERSWESVQVAILFLIRESCKLDSLQMIRSNCGHATRTRDVLHPSIPSSWSSSGIIVIISLYISLSLYWKIRRRGAPSRWLVDDDANVDVTSSRLHAKSCSSTGKRIKFSSPIQFVQNFQLN